MKSKEQVTDIANGFFNSRTYTQFVFIRLNSYPEECICVGMLYAGLFKDDNDPKRSFFHSDILISEEKLKLVRRILKEKVMVSYFKRTMQNIKKQSNFKINYLGMEYLQQNHHNSLFFSKPSIIASNSILQMETLFDKRVNTINV